MGFRSNFIASAAGYQIPQWFKEKYPKLVFTADGDIQSCFAQLFESKFYSSFTEDERFMDIQKMLKEDNKDWNAKIVLVLLHECDGITRVEISKDYIKASEPTSWKEVEYVEHDYCYGCSDIKKLL